MSTKPAQRGHRTRNDFGRRTNVGSNKFAIAQMIEVDRINQSPKDQHMAILENLKVQRWIEFLEIVTCTASKTKANFF